ncbi:5-carboxymethyl-2-hydroxymuconate Delta-isomerase [Psychrobacter sp.]|uniref:5-carboxymethyl-2-hydroxymuconate Delta-isomerase n=1 Tax=Psychrobacter sp. TaxID=56811 RepID=UPI003F9E662A
MPHLTLQATPNVSIPHEESLLKSLNQALWNSGHFGKPTDIKARIVPLETFLVGVEDDEQVNRFVYANFKLMAGRDLTIRNELSEILMTTLEAELATAQSDRTSLQICVEVVELSAVYKKKVLGS